MASVDEPRVDGETPLIKAARLGQAAEVRKLTEAGADVNARRNTEGATALHLAAYGGHLEVVKILVEVGNAELNPKNYVNKENDKDRTPLAWAGSNPNEAQRLAVTTYLQGKGAIE